MNKRQITLALSSLSIVIGLLSPSGTLAQADRPTGYNCLTREVWTPEKQAWCNKLRTLQNLTYRLPNFGTLTLRNGTFNSPTFKATLITQPGLLDFGDINGDETEDAIALMSVTPNNSSLSSLYLVPVLNLSTKPQTIAPMMLGNRTQVKSLTTQQGQFRLTLLDSRSRQTVTRIYQIQPQITIVRSMDQQLVNTEWLLEDLGGTGVIDRIQTTLRFDSSNRLVGSGGCNQYFAEYQTSGESGIKIGAIGATRKACPPAVMDQEMRFFQALERSQRIRMEGSFLFIDSVGSDQPLRFTRLTQRATRSD